MLWLLLLVPFTVASPVPVPKDLCAIPLIGHFVCQRSSTSFHLGTPIGQPTSNGVRRYSVRYASAKRWASPVISTTWSPPNASDPTALPLPCPQSGMDPSQFSEDCLSLVLYVPPTTKTTPGGLPTIVWVHGGSFIVGSATAPGLDASNLAIGANAIVAVVQYRLGTLGLLSPASSPGTSNLALQDLMTALTFLHTSLPLFGGSPSTPHLTLAGQSSGASLVRALLGTPAAASLFSNAWLHSDTLNYGFLTSGALNTLRGAWVSELGCDSAADCAQNMDLPTLIAHQSSLLHNAPGLSPEFFPSVPLRPSPSDGVFITHTFTRADAFPPQAARKPLVVTTVKDEATFPIFSAFPDAYGPLPAEELASVVASLLGPKRSATLLNSTFYTSANSSDVRGVLQTMGTDQIWRCAGWALARAWAAGAYAGVIVRGASYPGNDAVPECAAPGVVCHQDDIEVLFGTAPQNAGTGALTRELQARYAAFVRTGVPNARGYAEWRAAATGDARALVLGGQGAVPVQACAPEFWGGAVQFDYQVLGE